jgi:hypothetical protein
MSRNLQQKPALNKSRTKKIEEPVVAALAAACSYRRPRTTYSNWAWAPKRAELKT